MYITNIVNLVFNQSYSLCDVCSTFALPNVNLQHNGGDRLLELSSQHITSIRLYGSTHLGVLDGASIKALETQA